MFFEKYEPRFLDSTAEDNDADFPFKLSIKLNSNSTKEQVIEKISELARQRLEQSNAPSEPDELTNDITQTEEPQ